MPPAPATPTCTGSVAPAGPAGAAPGPAPRATHVADITHVINFDAPGDRDSYVRRIGRTGRAGRRGAGTSFVLGAQTAEMRRIAGDLGLIAEFERGLGRQRRRKVPA